MASNNTHSALSLARHLLRQSRRSAAAGSASARPAALSRPFSSNESIHDNAVSSSSPSEPSPVQPPAGASSKPNSQQLPRWAHTPERMKAPFPINIPKEPSRRVWSVNEDPVRLDAMYSRLLGRDGERMLPEELKWLAVTHKSFDQGRRGYNTRLAFFGRHILTLETTRSLLTAPIDPKSADLAPDAYGREPFRHPALDNVDKLNQRQPWDLVSPDKMGRLGYDVGLDSVMRWKPRMPEKLKASGIEVVINTTLFAIIGAISLQHGGEVASKVVRERILKRLS